MEKIVMSQQVDPIQIVANSIRKMKNLIDTLPFGVAKSLVEEVSILEQAFVLTIQKQESMINDLRKQVDDMKKQLDNMKKDVEGKKQPPKDEEKK